MRVLVTGHQGYLGTVMVPILQDAGHDVTGLDCGFFADCCARPRTSGPDGHPAWICGTSRANNLEGFEAVIHLAALSNDPLGALAPQITYDINHHASVRLARLAKEAGVRRFLYASTCSVYGAAGDDLVTESAPLRPLTPYAESKVRVEDDVAAIADDSFSPVFLRNATAFGFSPRLRADIVLNNLVGHAVLTGDVRVLSDGTPWRPLVHARDIAAAFLLALEAPIDKCIAPPTMSGPESNNLTVAEIAQSVVDVVPGARLLITGETGSDPRSYRVDFSAFRRALGFEAAWSIPDGAAELYKEYMSAGLTAERLRQEVHPAAASGSTARQRCSRRVHASGSRQMREQLGPASGTRRRGTRPSTPATASRSQDPGRCTRRRGPPKDRADDRSGSTRRPSWSAPGSHAGSPAARTDAESRCRRAGMPAVRRRSASPFECRPARRAWHRWRSGPASPHRAPSARACRGSLPSPNAIGSPARRKRRLPACRGTRRRCPRRRFG